MCHRHPTGKCDAKKLGVRVERQVLKYTNCLIISPHGRSSRGYLLVPYWIGWNRKPYRGVKSRRDGGEKAGLNFVFLGRTHACVTCMLDGKNHVYSCIDFEWTQHCLTRVVRATSDSRRHLYRRDMLMTPKTTTVRTAQLRKWNETQKRSTLPPPHRPPPTRCGNTDTLLVWHYPRRRTRHRKKQSCGPT